MTALTTTTQPADAPVDTAPASVLGAPDAGTLRTAVVLLRLLQRAGC